MLTTTLRAKLRHSLITPALLALGFFSSSAMATPIPAAPRIQPTPPQVAAKAFFLVDTDTGAILASKNPEKHLAPASLTKLMTLYLTFNALKSGQLHLEDKVLISNKAWKMKGSRMFLRPNTRVPVNQLIQGVIVDSGNDACEALAEHIAGSSADFASMMNDAAARLGMKNSHFENPTGLPHKEHFSSPEDLAKLASVMATEFPEYYHYFSQKWFRYNHIKQPNRNRLLWRDSSVDGLKTGHTDSAGYCLITSAKRDNMRLVSVVMGTKSDAARANVSQRLLNYGFRFYKTHKLFPANSTLSTARVWMGENKTINLGLAAPLAITIRSGDYNKLQARMNVDSKIRAPIHKGDTLGEVIVTLNNKTIAQEKLVALQADTKGGWFSRSIDSIKLGIKHIF